MTEPKKRIINEDPNFVLMSRRLYDQLMEDAHLYHEYNAEKYAKQVSRFNTHLIEERVAARREASIARYVKIKKMEALQALGKGTTVYIRASEVRRVKYGYWYGDNKMPDHVIDFLKYDANRPNDHIAVTLDEPFDRFQWWVRIQVKTPTMAFDERLTMDAMGIHIENPDAMDTNALLAIIKEDKNYPFIYFGPAGAVNCKVTMPHELVYQVWIETEDGSEFAVESKQIKPI